MAYYPMYVWVQNKPKLSIERQKTIDEEKMRFRKGAITGIRRLATELCVAFEERNNIQCFILAFRTERYINFHCKSFISEKHITQILEALYGAVGELYVRSKKLQVDMSNDKNDRRMCCMLGIEMPDTQFVRKVKASFMPHVLDKR